MLGRRSLGDVPAFAANLRELMERMGHSTSRAALICLHSTSERQHMLADAVAARVQSEPARGERVRVAAGNGLACLGRPGEAGVAGADRRADLLICRSAD